MNKKILKLAEIKLKELLTRYDGFNVVFLDDWRGFRFIYDCDESKRFRGKRFLRSRLYDLLRNEKPGIFTAGLYLASWEEKRLFGPQYFLNCKTYRQYANCYINFFLKKIRTVKEAKAELGLLKEMRIVFSKGEKSEELEQKFKFYVLRTVLKKIKKKEARDEVALHLGVALASNLYKCKSL